MTGFSIRLRKMLLGVILTVSTSAQIFGASIHEGGDVASGEKLFKANCASCHKVTDEVLAAPGLKGIDQRWAGKDALIVKWIQNPQAAAGTGDPYIKGLVAKYVGQFGWMAAQAVSEAEIKDILTYVKSGGGASAAPAAAGNDCPTIMEEINAEYADSGSSENMIWFIIIGVILAIIGASAANISKSLKTAVNEREGVAPTEDKTYWEVVKSWMWKYRVWVGVGGFVLFVYFFVVGYEKLYRIGVNQGYMPKQPIWFSHARHVCENEIDCQYCHSSAAKSKHAGIPSVNICMNCHNAIKRESPEIQKIYSALEKNEPIQWVRVHNLPDLAYFNHSQHTNVGALECKSCHGDVEKMEVVEQRSSLTMGWCIDCHRQTDVNAKGNAYYDKLVEVHNKDSKTPLKVQNIGGLECSKCHY